MDLVLEEAQTHLETEVGDPDLDKAPLTLLGADQANLQVHFEVRHQAIHLAGETTTVTIGEVTTHFQEITEVQTNNHETNSPQIQTKAPLEEIPFPLLQTKVADNLEVEEVAPTTLFLKASLHLDKIHLEVAVIHLVELEVEVRRTILLVEVHLQEVHFRGLQIRVQILSNLLTLQLFLDLHQISFQEGQRVHFQVTLHLLLTLFTKNTPSFSKK